MAKAKPTFIVLVSLDQAVLQAILQENRRTLKAAAAARAEAKGAKVLSLWITNEDSYQLVAVVEAPKKAVADDFLKAFATSLNSASTTILTLNSSASKPIAKAFGAHTKMAAPPA